MLPVSFDGLAVRCKRLRKKQAGAMVMMEWWMQGWSATGRGRNKDNSSVMLEARSVIAMILTKPI
jgi:hypothetical protein